MDTLKRKAPSHWGADPNEGYCRPRPVVITIPLIDEDDEQVNILELFHFINKQISKAPYYSKDKLKLQQKIT